MRYFPMFLDMVDRRVVLAGGGEQIAQKTRLLGRSVAKLTLMAEDLIPELAALVDAGDAAHLAERIDAAALADADFVFVATGNDDLDAKIADLARRGGALVNMVDKPDQCDMITPAMVDRDPVVVAIGTEGAAPVLAKEVKTRLEALLSPRLGGFTEMLRARRSLIAGNVAEGAGRLAFWNWAAKGEPWRLWLEGDEAGAAALVEAAAAKGAAPSGALGGLTVVGEPSAPDLISLRAVQRLQDASTIFHRPGVDPAILDLARRDAARVELTACPRLGPGAEAVAAALVEGPVVAIGADICASAAGLEVAETIAAAPGRGAPARAAGKDRIS